jgi:hypothetical protein
VDQHAQEFLTLCDQAIVAAEEIISAIDCGVFDSDLMEEASRTLEVLRVLRDRIVNGTLRRPSGGAGLGMTRAVGEWAEGTDLMRAVRALERYYIDNM